MAAKKSLAKAKKRRSVKKKAAGEAGETRGAVQIVRLDGDTYVVAKLSADLPENAKHNIEVTVKEVTPSDLEGCFINCSCNGKVTCTIL